MVMPFDFHPLFLIVVLAIVLIIFGPGKLPEVGGAIGRGIREFRRASSETATAVTKAVSEPDSGASSGASGADTDQT